MGLYKCLLKYKASNKNIGVLRLLVEKLNDEMDN
jgi:hypothetical protein